MSDIVDMQARVAMKHAEALIAFGEEVRAFAHRKFDALEQRGASREELYALHAAVIADVSGIAEQLRRLGHGQLVTRLALDQAMLTTIGAVAILAEQPAYGTASLTEALKATFDTTMGQLALQPVGPLK